MSSKINRLKSVLIGALFIGISACSDESEINNEQKVTGRWYTAEQVEVGKKVYLANCIHCHLEDAKGTQEWKKTLADGSYPPPPLNGTAHAWHHSIEVLLKVINDGGIPFGGKMPAFKDSLSDSEKYAVIAYFQHFWPEDIYQRWELIK